MWSLARCILELRARVEALEGRYATTMAALIQAQHERKDHLQRIEALEVSATCPHIVSSDEGTSYCGLAEQQAAAPPEPAPDGPLGGPLPLGVTWWGGRKGMEQFFPSPQQIAEPAPAGSLVLRINNAWPDGNHTKGDLALAAIRATAEWLNNRGQHMAAALLFKEADR